MTDDRPTIAVLGARSPVGDAVVGMLAEHATVLRFSRGPRDADRRGSWHRLGQPLDRPVDAIVSLMPIWALADHHNWLAASGCRRVVALSSTSRFTKEFSGRAADRELADRLRRGEEETMAWAERAGVEVVLVRPTMIYGHDRDGNVASMRSILRRFRLFPVVGRADGLRQPVHVDDVAWVASRLATAPLPSTAPAYTASGGEVLTYRAMVDRVRQTVPGPTIVVRIPAAFFRLAERLVPGSRIVHIAAGMADRMASDMVFGHREAHDDLGYSPRAFDPTPR